MELETLLSHQDFPEIQCHAAGTIRNLAAEEQNVVCVCVCVACACVCACVYVACVCCMCKLHVYVCVCIEEEVHGRVNCQDLL